MNTGKPNGRPPKTERNAKIIAAFNGGKPCKKIASELGLSVGYVQKIASEYKFNEQKKKESPVIAPLPANFFMGLDLCLWNFIAGLKGKTRKHTGNENHKTRSASHPPHLPP